MKKSHLILIVLLLMVVGYAATQIKIDIKGNTTLSENTSDFKVYLANLKLNGTEIEGINETKDKYEINVPSKGTLEYDVINDSTEYDVEAIVECEEKTGTDTVMDIPYTGKESVFYIQKNGTYKLETWGAEGGKTINITGGYGGYSVGYVNLNVKNVLYINIGGSGIGGNTWIEKSGGYNGGGSASINSTTGSYNASGGGATHIALKSGLLSTLENDKDNILIVSGGGAGGGNNSNYNYNIVAGSGCGYIGGNSSTFTSPSSKKQFQGFGGTQTSGGNRIYNSVTESVDTTNPNFGTFGQGGGSTSAWSGSGGGFYGGSSSGYNSGGGSGYIGNASLTNKVMYCYNCEESEEESTKTVSTTCVSADATENCAKSGNGHVRITQVSPIVSSVQLETTTIEAQDKVNKSVEVSNKGMTCSLKIKKLSRTEKKDKYSGPTEWTFDYTGGEQTFTAPANGTYKIETWGAQGGASNTTYIGGYGGYSIGKVVLPSDKKIYINVGGKGGTNSTPYSSIGAKGGYNGGGTSNGCTSVNHLYGAGGGATHIALSSGLLSTFENNQDDLLIVSGGGGGGRWQANYEASRGKGGSGGGIVGVTGEQLGTNVTYATGGTQTSGGDIIYVSGTTIEAATTSKKISYSKGFFGKGATTTGVSAGGGGYYGGAGTIAAGGGGSGYIGNPLLTEKSMYCYNCQESTEENTKTISTTCVNSTPTENCAKSGNGYARITLIK